MILEWYGSALNDKKMEIRARDAGMDITYGSFGRHRRLHLTEADSIEMDESLAELDDVEALDEILKQGQKNIRNWKVTPSEYFKAMELKYKLTQGSTMDAMYAAMAKAGSDEGEEDSASEDRPDDLEEDSEGQSSLREDISLVRPPSGSEDVARE